MIEAIGLRKQFGRFAALDGVSLSVRNGEAVALWGPNGAGKTTLLRCVLGLINFEGIVRIGGVDVRRRGREARRLLGYVPQEQAFYEDFRVSEAVAFFARLRRASREACHRAIEHSGLEAHMRKRVGHLSGGMRQRLALGIALLTNPDLLILDEPTSNLDAAGRTELLTELARLRSRGKTILFTSHRPEEVEELADRVVTLESGQIVDDREALAIGPIPGMTDLRIPCCSLERALDALRDCGLRADVSGGPGPILCRNGFAGPAAHEAEASEVRP